MRLPPLNLWNWPRQPELEKELRHLSYKITMQTDDIDHCKRHIKRVEQNRINTLANIKRKRFIYYIRTGRMLE